MELNSLPDDCFLLLFELFPVNVQAQLRAVCTRWNWLIERVWLKVNKIDIKYELKVLCVAFDNHQMSFKVKSCLERFVTREHFPGVTALSFDSQINEELCEAQLSHCLEQWTATLTDLTLKLFRVASHEYHSSVWTQIDSMKSLKSLELNFPYLLRSKRFNYLRCIPWKVPDSLSILTNLEKLELNDRDCKEEVGALTQLGPNLRYLILHEKYTSPNSCKQIVSTLPKLISLTELSIDIYTFRQPFDLFTSLAQLSQLSKLKLVYFEWNNFISLNTHNLEYPKLTSVKHLSLVVCFHPYKGKRTPEVCFQLLNDFDRHFFATIAIMFHALEVIDVEFAFYNLYDQAFVDKFNDKLKLKFVKLREAKFTLGHDRV